MEYGEDPLQMSTKKFTRVPKAFSVAKTALIAAAAAAFVVSAPSAHAEYYDGKTVSVLVGFPPGGGASLVVQNFAPYWSKHTPGNPTFIIQNMPGAGGSKAVNFIYDKGRIDGETILFSSSKIAGETLGAIGDRAKHTEFEIIGLVYDKYMAFGRTDSGGGISKTSDLVNLDSIKMAARSPNSTLDVTGQLALNMLGVKHEFVCCYRGTSPMGNAIQSGEAEMGFFGSTDYRANYEATMVAAGDAMPFFYLPTRTVDGDVLDNDPDFPDMPSFSEVYKEVKGEAPGGIEWDALEWLRLASARMAVAPPGTDPEAVAALRAGFIAAQQDPEFIASHEKLFGLKWIYYSGEDGAGVFTNVKDADPKLIEFLKANYFDLQG